MLNQAQSQEQKEIMKMWGLSTHSGARCIYDMYDMYNNLEKLDQVRSRLSDRLLTTPSSPAFSSLELGPKDTLD